MLDESKTRNKVVKDMENKEVTTFRCYSPQVDKVIEAPTREEREEKVKELLHANQQE